MVFTISNAADAAALLAEPEATDDDVDDDVDDVDADDVATAAAAAAPSDAKSLLLKLREFGPCKPPTFRPSDELFSFSCVSRRVTICAKSCTK